MLLIAIFPLTTHAVGLGFEDREKKFLVEPGGTYQSKLILNNNSEEQIEMIVTFLDGKQTDKSISYSSSNKPVGVGAWSILQLEKGQDLFFNPNETKVIPFSISVPQDASPGIYAGALSVTEGTESSRANKNTSVQVVKRYLSSFNLIVLGEQLSDFSMTSLQSNIKQDSIEVAADFHNRGNTWIETESELILTNHLSGESFTYELQAQRHLSDSAIKQEYEIERPFFGYYNLEFISKISEYDTELGLFKPLEKQSASINIFIIPKIYASIISIVAILFLLYIIIKFVRYLNIRNKTQIYMVGHDEDLESIASKYDIRWKMIARLNGIHRPFHISPGQKILIPQTHNHKKNEEK